MVVEIEPGLGLIMGRCHRELGLYPRRTQAGKVGKGVENAHACGHGAMQVGAQGGGGKGMLLGILRRKPHQEWHMQLVIAGHGRGMEKEVAAIVEDVFAVIAGV